MKSKRYSRQITSLALNKTQHKFPEKTKPLLEPKRYKVLFGGRGSSKSWSVARFLIIMGTAKKLRILCTRELQMSIRESVHKLLSDTITAAGLDDFYEVEKGSIYGLNGTQFIFEGLKNNTRKIKSLEAVDICWCEESESISEESWDLLIPTIRAPNSEIWIVFNPADEMDDTYQRFVAPYIDTIERDGIYQDDTITVIQMNYTDNPFFPEELRKEMEQCKRDDYKKYLHIWQGECIADYEDSIIDPLWVRASIDAHVKLGFRPLGIKSVGYDPADTGGDAKGYILRHGSVVTDTGHWLTGDITDANDRVFKVAQEAGADSIVYDGIGVGTAVKEYLRRVQGNDKITVESFIGSSAPLLPKRKFLDGAKNEDVFKNRRAQAFWDLRGRFERTFRAVERGEYIDPDTLISLDSNIPHLKILVSELSKIQRKRNNTNTAIQIESKQDMKARNLASPALADSLMYAFSNKPIDLRNNKYDGRALNI